MSAMTTAIIVDWTHYKGDPTTQRYIQRITTQAPKTSTVLMVSDPNDTLSCPSHIPEIEWDVIIRNTGTLNDVKFKTKAFSVITEVSDLVPVIAFDDNHQINLMYRENGVLITLEDFTE